MVRGVASCGCRRASLNCACSPAALSFIKSVRRLSRSTNAPNSCVASEPDRSGIAVTNGAGHVHSRAKLPQMMVGVAIRPPLPISRRHCSDKPCPGSSDPRGRGNPLQRTHEAPAIAIEVTGTRPLDPGIVQGIGGHTARPPRRQPQPEVLCERPSPDTNRLRPGPLERHHFAGIAEVTEHLVRRERAQCRGVSGRTRERRSVSA